ncbi:uncharacterized protein [Thunnus thynnus]|uniref:uncharacterized protein n=1 Tax=Thunnus thynnus TaxID=8237 RepID=UPI0035279E8A
METLNVIYVSSVDFADCKVSKAEILRGMIADKLTTAAQEILAVVERTVAGYEEEASGFRQEIDRQRRQLEVLLQPQVKLCRIDDEGLLPVCEEEEEAGGDKLPEKEEEQHTQQTHWEDSWSQDVLHHTEEEEGEDEEEAAEEPVQSTSPDQQDQTSNTRGQSVKRKNRRSGPLNLRVCLLKDSVTSVQGQRSSQVTRSSVQDVRCPRGLQEADFLDLLRSRFPQLTGRFDVFTADASKKLWPLEVGALTAEEIQRSIQSTGRRRSALYIRAKVGDEEQTCEEDRERDNTADSLTVSMTTSDDTMKHTSNPVSRVEINKEDALPSSARIQLMETEDDDDDDDGGTSLDPTSDSPAPSPAHSAADKEENHVDDDRNKDQKPDESATDASKRKRPVLPPSFSSAEDGQGEAGDEDVRDDDGKPDEDDEAQSSNTKTRHSLQLRVCLLKDMQTNVLSKRAYKHPVQKLTCPRGLREADFLDLLRSTFPELPGGDRPFDVFLTDKCKRLQPLRVKTLTPEEVHRSIKSTGKGRSALYIRLKTAKKSLISKERLPPPQRKDEAANDALSTSSALTGSDETRPHASSHNKETEETEDGDDGEDCGTSEPDKIRAISSSCPAAESKGDDDDDDEEEEEVMVDDRDGDWKPDKCDEELEESEPEPNSSKTARKPQVKHSGVKTKRSKRIHSSPKASTENSDALLSCKVCTVLCTSTNMLVKHVWSHVDDPERVCGVCGEHSESAEELRSHLQSHQKTHSCNICGKSFMTVSSLNRHASLHTEKRQYKCDVCHKAYTHKSGLKNHKWEHVEDKPHKCDICHQSFGFPQQLRIHMRRHTGEKPYRCKECGKSVSDFRSLTRHMLLHTGEKRYSCQVCGKHFLFPGKLKEHEKIHTDRSRTHLCHVCCKTFHRPGELKAHLETHNKERSHMCGECGKGMSSRGALKRHMIIHSGERPYGCSECGQTFSCWNVLRSHQKTHSSLKPFVCGVCGKTFKKKEYVTVHMRTHNGERPYKCSLCDKAFTQSHCVKTHMKSHQREETSAVDGLMLG